MEHTPKRCKKVEKKQHPRRKNRRNICELKALKCFCPVLPQDSSQNRPKIIGTFPKVMKKTFKKQSEKEKHLRNIQRKKGKKKETKKRKEKEKQTEIESQSFFWSNTT